jgi:hypothetical protein
VSEQRGVDQLVGDGELEAKRMRGEWFKLDAADVRAFKRWRRVY